MTFSQHNQYRMLQFRDTKNEKAKLNNYNYTGVGICIFL